jgi:hypothetical protein
VVLQTSTATAPAVEQRPVALLSRTSFVPMRTSRHSLLHLSTSPARNSSVSFSASSLPLAYPHLCSSSLPRKIVSPVHSGLGCRTPIDTSGCSRLQQYLAADTSPSGRAALICFARLAPVSSPVTFDARNSLRTRPIAVRSLPPSSSDQHPPRTHPILSDLPLRAWVGLRLGVCAASWSAAVLLLAL